MKFSELELHPLVAAGIEANQFVDCTPIQEASIPIVLQGKDLAGLAQTGTGKTAAFVIPLMDRLVRSREVKPLSDGVTDAPAWGGSVTAEAATVATATVKGEGATVVAPSAVSAEGATVVVPTSEAGTDASSSQENVAGTTLTEATSTSVAHPVFAKWHKSNFILVLVPTRELAEQVCENVLKLGKAAGIRAAAIYGGTSYEPQKAALKQGVEFIVATPGRLIDLYKEHQVDLNLVRAIVFDEADRMFDMGFKDDMKYILRRVPRDRQFLVFSATLNFDVLNTAYEFGAEPVEVNVSRDQAKADNVQDEIFHVGQDEKPKFLFSLLQKHQPKQTIIFSNFKHNVERIAKFLTQNGIPAMGISSLISQSQRNRIMELFRAENNDRNVLVATDVAARGLDIKGVDMVINFELPDDAENYVHRIGRTGRAGAKGQAYSLVSDRDVEALQRIENYLGYKVTIGWLDETDVLKDLKEFPRDESRRRPDFRRDERGGGRPRQEGRGGFRDGERGGRPRREGRGPGGDRGGFRDGERSSGPQHQEGQPPLAARTEHGAHGGEGRQEGSPRHSGQSGSYRHGGRGGAGRYGDSNRGRGADAQDSRRGGHDRNSDSAQHEGRAPFAARGGEHGGGKHVARSTHGGAHAGRSSDRAQRGSQGQQRGSHSHQGGATAHKRGGGYRQKFPHGQSRTAKGQPSAATGLAGKVSGFFKKIFGK